MKVTKHVEHLLRQGQKPKELIELGFPKSVVTRVRRQLRKEKTVPQTKIPQEGQKVDSLAQLLPEVAVLMAAAKEVGTDKREGCPHEKDGVCTLYAWTSRDDIPQGIGEPVLLENGKSEWHIKPTPLYCAMCTAILEDRIDDVEIQALGNPLSGARDQITCNGCGSKGYIAVAMKCTKCGRETYWGWWPKKE